MSDENTPITDLIPDFDKEKYSLDVPEMPPVDNDMGSDSHQGNWLWVHYDSTNHNYRNEASLKAMPAPLNGIMGWYSNNQMSSTVSMETGLNLLACYEARAQ